LGLNLASGLLLVGFAQMAASSKIKFAIISGLLTMIALHALLFWRVSVQAFEGVPDFSIFYTAALILRRGEGGRLYDDALQKQIQQEFAPLVTAREEPLPFNHPPFEALLYWPLAHLSYLHAYLLWMLVNFLLLVQIARFLRPYLPTLTSLWSWWPWLIGIGFFPSAFSLIQGQDSILLLGAYCLAFVSLKRGNDFLAGMFLALGLFKFHLVLPFFLLLLLRKRWRFVAGFAISGLGLGLISLALVGWRELLYYPRYVWIIDRFRHGRAIAPRNMPNLRGLIEGWHWHVPTLWLGGLVALASVSLLAWAFFQWNPSDREHGQSWNAGFSIALITTFLVGYHSYDHDMSIVLLPALLLLDHWLAAFGNRQKARATACCLGLLFCSPLYLVLTLRYQHPNLLALVLLCLVLLVAGRKEFPGRNGLSAAMVTTTAG
jgi:Glycosyltransferase family 87